MKGSRGDWVEGKLYTYDQVMGGLEGGRRQFYLPYRGRRVFGALLDPNLNPEAPEKILVGNRRDVPQAAILFWRQQTPVPTFVKKATNQWEFKGEYAVADIIEQNEAARLGRKCTPPRSTIAFGLRLEKAEGASASDRQTLEAFVQSVTAPLRARPEGQGRDLSARERKLVENEAMRQAAMWLTDQGFEFQNVSAFDSCDFRAQRQGEKWVIEVKGTTAGPETVLVTPNEIALHLQSHPRTALLIVHGIVLSKDGTKASGGALHEIVPWALDEKRLKPVCYEYRVM
jgi:hypothetical protein